MIERRLGLSRVIEDEEFDIICFERSLYSVARKSEGRRKKKSLTFDIRMTYNQLSSYLDRIGREWRVSEEDTLDFLWLGYATVGYKEEVKRASQAGWISDAEITKLESRQQSVLASERIISGRVENITGLFLEKWQEILKSERKLSARRHPRR